MGVVKEGGGGRRGEVVEVEDTQEGLEGLRIGCL